MYRKIIKPSLDFIIALILIIIFSPLMIVVATIIYIDLGKPIYNLRREREGKGRKTFIMYKFRTKTIDRNNLSKEGEYTKTSKIIDSFRLNELPQLFNVLKGDMSLIGPRPFIPGDNLQEGEVSEKRYLLKPGITGLAQVSGGRAIYHRQKLKYDVEYYDNLNFKTDMKIVYKTICKLTSDSIDKRVKKK